MTRATAIATVAGALQPNWLAVACNGMISRELFAHADAPTRFYMIGSMGLAASIGLGLALVQPERTVVVFDGDGNVLMNMGVLGTIGAAAPSNMYHVVFDNASHGSTGGQPTVSDRVALEKVAEASGYRHTLRISAGELLNDAVETFFRNRGPAMLLVEVERGNEPGIGRVKPSPIELTARFRAVSIDRAET